MSHRKYMLDLLSKIGKLGANPCSTLMMSSMKLLKDGEPFKDTERDKRLVEKLNCLIITRLDIAYFVSVKLLGLRESK